MREATPLQPTFTPTDAADYSTATATVTLTVSPATETLSWTTPAAITYGTALSATQLNATSTVPGIFAYSLQQERCCRPERKPFP